MFAIDTARADLVEAILDGKQPRAMELQPMIMRRLPMEWDRQRCSYAAV